MEGRDFPSHLRPVPDSGGSTAPALEPEAGGTPGLTPPIARGRSTGFVTDVLVDLGYVGEDRARQAIEEARTAARPPEELLLSQGAITPDQLSRAVAERYGLDHVDLSIYQVDMAAANLIPVNTARRYRALPVGFVDKETLLVAMADPTNVLAVDDIQIATALDCRVAVAALEDIEALIGRLNTLQSAVTEAVVEEEEEDELAAVSDIEVSAEDAPVIKLVYSILGQAVGEGASDVHFEPEEDGMRVRFRVDGVLREAANVPKRMVGAVVSRIKIMSDLNIAEKRVPQDGRVSITVEERRVDLRITTLPTQRGEGATIRILDKDNAQRSLDDLGMDGGGRERFEEAFHQAYGAVLVTGPTGSGKSTTLYAALQDLNQIEKKIITVEDPVEYQQPGISQIQVQPKIGLTFASSLRSILRHDPDVILIGEIRDLETAENAIQASLTGHLVFSTLHTNDAPSTFTRLIDMGVEPFLVSSTVEGVMAQRLVRTICKECKVEYEPHISELPNDFPGVADGNPPKVLWRGKGCRVCHQTGLRGRTGIHELLVNTDRIKDLIVQRTNANVIRNEALKLGMITLRQDGWKKVQMGITTIDEVARATAADLT
jgi:type IV pilus assembly protein PilB